jgi:DNA/RNA-binding domain of Phe-tRNA-synthetase-like protein
VRTAACPDTVGAMADVELAAAVDAAVFERHPDYVAVILVAEGLVSGPTDAASDDALRVAEAHLRGRGLARAADAPQIAAWRAAFSSFGAKPSRYPCSAEALAARVLKGDPLPRVNRVVDHYNAVSVRHLVPVGGEDLDRLDGPLRLTVADGSERFDVADGTEHPEPGEIVWRDDLGVTCRRWNWRQGTRTRLTESSTRAFFVFDRLAGLDMDGLEAATDALTAVLAAGRGCRVDRLVLAP